MQYRSILKTLILLISFEFIYQIAGAQDCELTLDKAQKLYESGIIEDIPRMLSPCIEHGFSPLDRLRAYKLLILSYLFDQNLDDANKSMLKFLKEYPEYELQTTDPAEFAQLFKSFRIIRIFSIGFSAGGNLSFPMIMKNYATNDQNIKGTYKNSGIGYEGGIRLNFYMAPRFVLNLEGYYFSNSFAYNLNQPGQQQISSKEVQTKIEIPLTLTYDLGRRKVRPYIGLGGSLDYLISATASEDLNVISQGTDISGSGINLKSRRNQLNYNGIIDCGVKFKITRGFLFFDIRWKQGLFNQALANGRYNTVETFQYQNPDDNYSLSNLIFSVGYIHSFFKAKKKSSN